MKEIKPWRCGKGHVMGMVVRNGSGVQLLHLFRLAIDMGEEKGGSSTNAEQEVPHANGANGEGKEDGSRMAEVDVAGIVEGKMVDWRCSVCGGVRSWFPASERKYSSTNAANKNE